MNEETINAETVQRVTHLLDAIATTSGPTRDTAEHELHAMGITALSVMRVLLAPSFERIKAGWKRIWILTGCLFAATGLCFVVMAYDIRLACILMICFIPVIVWICVIEARCVKSLPKATIEALLGFDNKAAIALLLEALEIRWASFYRGQICERLTCLLPTLTASDSAVLSSDHIRVLNSILDLSLHLGHALTTDLIIAVLKALSQLGNASSIRVMARVARVNRDLTVRQTANDCILLLKARSTTEHNTLLRAASDTGNGLLRAASNTTRHDELLRPTAPDRDIED